jgi:serine/threonine-protein kinase
MADADGRQAPDADETRAQETTARAAQTIGPYRLLEPIGEGGMGQVWKAHDNNLDRDVAIKLLLRGTVTQPAGGDRFRREAHILSRLSHPGVATVFDFDIQNGHEFLVMELVPGGTLESQLAAGPLPIERVIEIGAAIADALDHAHRHGILHRDLKPGNVVLSAEGSPKILDFGLALLLADGKAIGRMTEPGMIMGSLAYMAPEQLFGDADARTDIYALGAVLFEMATGQRLFVRDRIEALMFAIINNAAPSARSLRADVPAELDRLLADGSARAAEIGTPTLAAAYRAVGLGR